MDGLVRSWSHRPHRSFDRPRGLRRRSADAFHVVIPSLPGYGFSGKPTETGYNPERMADVLAGLMERLGYDRYVRREATGVPSSAEHLRGTMVTDSSDYTATS